MTNWEPVSFSRRTLLSAVAAYLKPETTTTLRCQVHGASVHQLAYCDTQQNKQQVTSSRHAVHHLVHKSPKKTSSAMQAHSTYFTTIYEIVHLLKVFCFRYCHYSTCISQLYRAFYVPSHLLWFDDDDNNNNRYRTDITKHLKIQSNKTIRTISRPEPRCRSRHLPVCAMIRRTLRLQPYVHGKYRVTWQRVNGCVQEGVNIVVMSDVMTVQVWSVYRTTALAYWLVEWLSWWSHLVVVITCRLDLCVKSQFRVFMGPHKGLVGKSVISRPFYAPLF